MTIAAKMGAALFAAAVFCPLAADAGTIVGLVDGNSLVMIDAADRKVTGKVHIKGGFDKILGIDRRPADGKLYGITSDGTIVTIDFCSVVAFIAVVAAIAIFRCRCCRCLRLTDMLGCGQ